MNQGAEDLPSSLRDDDSIRQGLALDRDTIESQVDLVSPSRYVLFFLQKRLFNGATVIYLFPPRELKILPPTFSINFYRIFRRISLLLASPLGHSEVQLFSGIDEVIFCVKY